MAHILIIEDEVGLLEEIADLLSLEGHKTISAHNGQEGVVLARSHLPDLIICDIMMPEMDGYDVLETLQQETETDAIPFIFLTAQATSQQMRQGMNLGADDYIFKPFQHWDLLNAVETRLIRSERYQEASDSRAQHEKSNLIKHIAHELRNPLTGMKLASSILLQQLSTIDHSDLGDLLETHQHGERRMSHLITQLLIESKLQTHELTRDSLRESAKKIPIWTLLTGAVEQGRSRATTQDAIHIDIEVESNDAVIYGDVDLLKHALSEIIANAIDFSPIDKSVYIRQQVDDDMLHISVFDDGAGMNESQIKRALMPFTHSSMVQTSNRRLGLGLSIARQLVELHGGQLNIVSTLGKGTAVVIKLPHL